MTSKMSRGEGSREANLGGGDDARRTLARVDGWVAKSEAAGG